MKLICAVLVVCFLGMCLGNDPTAPKSPIPQAKNSDKGEKSTHNKNDTVPVDVNNDSKKPHSTTTLAPTSASSAPTTTPSAPTTTPSAPTTTPSAPTKTPPAPSPAPPAPTPAPPAPTPAPPAPTPAPPTPVKPEYGIGSWNVTDDKGHACILLKGDIEMNLFDETDKKVSKKVIETYRVPKNAPSHGKCSEECIMFELPNGSSLHLMFKKNDSKFYIHAMKANLTYTVENKTQTFPFANDSLHLFETSLDQSYYCAPASENLIVQEPLMHLTLKVSDFQVQAYKNSSTNNFDSAENCEASHTPDVVPIVVGCLLALLVILVLVAYLISRRRSQSRGYISM